MYIRERIKGEIQNVLEFAWIVSNKLESLDYS